MEKRTAHYSLERIQELLEAGEYVVTLSARKSYTELGLCDEEVLDIVHSLTPRNLYKSMTSHHDHTLWHDVYHTQYRHLELYIKLQVTDRAVIISFKERT